MSERPHFLVAQYRGAAPIQWAIINGEPETGVTIMRMDIGLDTGAILTQEYDHWERRASETLHNRLAQIGGKLLVATIPEYVGGNIIARAQPTEGVSYAPKITKDDGLVNWADKATKIHDRIRGNRRAWPGAFTYFPSPQGMQTLKIWQATTVAIDGNPARSCNRDENGILVGCGEGGLLIQVLQREGRRKVTAAQFIAGNPLEKGVRLGKPPT